VELWSPELALNLEIEVSYLEQCWMNPYLSDLS
jgi:hypothetical protein